MAFIFSGSGFTLQFNPVDKDDSGDYVCEAQNVAGTTQAVMKLDVQCKPLSYKRKKYAQNNDIKERKYT